MAGATWKPLAPAPIMTTFLPVRSTEWSQRAVWNDGPAKASAPGRSGTNGWLSWPTALITARARSTSVRPSASRTVTDQSSESSFQAADSTSVLNRTCSVTLWRSMTSVK